MFPTAVARLAVATILVGPFAGVLAVPAAAEPSARTCGSDAQIVDLASALQPQQDLAVPVDLVPVPLQEPSASCGSELDDCMSASVQIGIYGERYVPPDATAACYEAYRACTAQGSGDEGFSDEGVG